MDRHDRRVARRLRGRRLIDRRNELARRRSQLRSGQRRAEPAFKFRGELRRFRAARRLLALETGRRAALASRPIRRRSGLVARGRRGIWIIERSLSGDILLANDNQ